MLSPPLALIERAQFAWNPKLYQPGAIPELEKAGHHGSWLDWFLKETESMHGERLFIAARLDPSRHIVLTALNLHCSSQGPAVREVCAIFRREAHCWESAKSALVRIFSVRTSTALRPKNS